MQLAITALYAGILSIFALALSFVAGSFRGKVGVSVLFGEPANMELAQKVRVHQNFLEYVPLLLILMAAVELNGGSATFLHVVGVALIVSRIAHAVGLKHDNMGHPGRAIGAGGTALLTLAAAGYAIWLGAGSILA
ncbi:MAG: MAPEG family protein [Gammaproteobacteria bacterium]|nr:MAPEG family protein [Gammaproteobacteria bacterium]